MRELSPGVWELFRECGSYPRCVGFIPGSVGVIPVSYPRECGSYLWKCGIYPGSVGVIPGFFIFLFHCLLNSEVRAALKHKTKVWSLNSSSMRNINVKPFNSDI
ncbi:hypothetical protein scyTo_0018820, partial [Scyliorhinus torazame]|nr:hypothetical protein [Scyliorhinus torazame]